MWLCLPAADATAEAVSSQLQTLAPFDLVDFEPVGRAYEACFNRCSAASQLESSTLPSAEKSLRHEGRMSDDDDEDDNVSDDDGAEDSASAERGAESLAYVRSLDPKQWKHQDHYRVLGLQHRRHLATQNEIRKAFRRALLQHHPDKRAARGERVPTGAALNHAEDSDYFSCITRAYDLLSNPKQRRAFDSVDPVIDDSVPPANEANRVGFYEVFGPVFERNARWSTKPNVPKLGLPDATEDEVTAFYNFWYGFDSWRDYSYLDEEDKERGENRDERRCIERENRAQRQKRKRDEMKRIRQLVDNALECDPRIRAFREAAQRRKDEARQRRAYEARAQREREDAERRAREEAERVERERREREEREVRERDKRARDAIKQEHRKQKRRFEALCAAAGNFAEPGSAQLVRNLELIDQIVRVLPSDELAAINTQMELESAASLAVDTSADNSITTSSEAGLQADQKRRAVFERAVGRLEEMLQREKMDALRVTLKAVSIDAGVNGHDSGDVATNSANRSTAASWNATDDWSQEEVHHLVKAVNLFPAGTSDRWEVVAQYIAQHSGRGITRTAKDVLHKAKNMQKSTLWKGLDGGSCTANLKPAQQGEETIAGINEEKISSYSEVPRAWTNDEQKLLEQALKTYPVSLGPTRWDKIAEALPNRTKKECMKRYKDLVETVKAKKAAVAAASNLKVK